MNLNEIQTAWNSPLNNLPNEEQQRLAGKFTRQMIRQRRFRSIWLINTFVWLSLITVLAIWAICIGKTKPGQEWGLIPLLAAPWTFAIHLLRRHLKPGPANNRGELSVIDSLRAALSSNRMEQSHLKRVLGLFALMVPLLGLSMWQLHKVGKVSARELESMAVFFGGIMLLSSAGIAARYLGRVLPQQRQLNTLLSEFNDPTQ